MSFFKTLGLFFVILGSFLFPRSSQINLVSDHANILIMGAAGGEHEGPDLTDTIILASISFSKQRVDLISIPRDIWMPDIRAKINSAYHYGGSDLAKKEVAEITGIETPYFALVDFSAFKDIVDALGGIEVQVDRSFTDNFYPIAGRENDTCGGDKTYKCRYETVTFNEGKQTMNGETALKFVRSRHAEGEEGTDTAREARQQKVIDAIKNKVLTREVIFNPGKDLVLFRIMRDHIKTDIDEKTGATIARKIYQGRNSINRYLIPQELLINPPISKTYDLQYVFIPRLGNGKWSEINSWVNEILK